MGLVLQVLVTAANVQDRDGGLLDWENRNHNALAFLRLASIRLMLRRLCNPS